ncbi:MAG: hypothetical protein ACLFVU_07370 [Phycisphaerae bacterium]
MSKQTKRSNGNGSADSPLLQPAPPLEAASPGAMLLIGTLVLTVIGGWVRAEFLDHPIRPMEAKVFLDYVAPGSLAEWLNFRSADNMILHTLLVRTVATRWGFSPYWIRMPALMAGMLLIPAVGELTRLISGRRWAALAAGALVAASGLMIELSVTATGHSLLLLWTVLLAIATVYIVRNVAAHRAWMAWAIFGGLGMLTSPAMLYPIVLLAGVIALQAWIGPAGTPIRRRAMKRLGLTLLGTFLLTLLLYAPVVMHTGFSEFLRVRPFQARRIDAVPVDIGGIWWIITRHWAVFGKWMWLLVVVPGLTLATGWGVVRKRVLPLIGLLGLFLLAVAMLIHGAWSFPGMWYFLVPLLFSAGAAGWAALPRREIVVAVSLVIAVVAGLSMAAVEQSDRLIATQPRTLTNAEEILRDAADVPGAALFASDLHQPTLEYYELLNQVSAPTDLPPERILLVVGPWERLDETMAEIPQIKTAYGTPQLWKQYPRAKVYLLRRKPPATGPSTTRPVPQWRKPVPRGLSGPDEI